MDEIIEQPTKTNRKKTVSAMQQALEININNKLAEPDTSPNFRREAKKVIKILKTTPNLTAQDILSLQQKLLPKNEQEDFWDELIIKEKRKAQQKQEFEKQLEIQSLNEISEEMQKNTSKLQTFLVKLRQFMTWDKKYIISFKNPTRQRWDVFVLALSVWNSIQIPIDICFSEIDKSARIKNFDSVIDLCFFIDFVIMFFTSVVDHRGKIVTDSVEIALIYMSTRRFYLDLMSLVSIYGPFRLFGFTKMFRVQRLTQFINRLKVEPLLKTFFKIVKLIFYLFLLLHILGCFMWFIVKIKRDAIDYDGRSLMYYPPLDWVDFTQSELLGDKISIFKKYLICLYYGVLILGLNEMGPVNTDEMLFFIFVLLLSALMNSLIFSDVVLLIDELTKASQIYQEKLDSMFSVMDVIKLPEDYQFEVKLFFQKTQPSRDKQLQLDEFLSVISPSLQQKVNSHIYRKNILSNSVVQKFMKIHDDDDDDEVYLNPRQNRRSRIKRLQTEFYDFLSIRNQYGGLPFSQDSQQEKNNDLFIQSFVYKLQTAMYVPENEIIKQGEPPQGVFFVSNGDCIVDVRDQNGINHNLHRLLVEGDHFGEISSIYRCNTSATVVARNYNIMAMISQDRFRELTIDFPDYLKLLKKYVQKYKDPRINFLKKVISKIYYLRDLTKEELNEILFSLKTEFHSRGDQIMTENYYNKADRMIIVESGCIESFTYFEGNEFVIDYLNQGSIINFRSFLVEDDIKLNMRCASQTVIQVLELETFQKILLNHPRLSKIIENVKKSILWLDQKFPLDYMIPFAYNMPMYKKQNAEKINKDRIQKAKNSFRLKNTLKNVVFCIILEVRNEKKKPKIGDIINLFHQQSDQGKKGKEAMIKKIKKMYPRKAEDLIEEEDPKFDQLFSLIDRISKAINRHKTGLESLDNRLQNLIHRREKRLQNQGKFRRDQKRYHQYIQTKKVVSEIKKFSEDRINTFMLKNIKKEISNGIMRSKMSLADQIRNDIAIEDNDFASLSKFASKPKKDQEIQPFKSAFLDQFYNEKVANNKVNRVEEIDEQILGSIYLGQIDQDMGIPTNESVDENYEK